MDCDIELINLMEVNSRVFVDNLPKTMEKADLQKQFEEFGEVLDSKIIK